MGRLQMSHYIGPVSIVWEHGPVVVSAGPVSGRWGIGILGAAPVLKGPFGADWFNNDEWSGVETASWVAWISNRTRSAVVWGASPDITRRDALAVVIPAVLRLAVDPAKSVSVSTPTVPPPGTYVEYVARTGHEAPGVHN